VWFAAHAAATAVSCTLARGTDETLVVTMPARAAPHPATLLTATKRLLRLGQPCSPR